MNKLYIERPDNYGNCGYLVGSGVSSTPCVIEAEILPSNGLSATLIVVAPEEVKKKWPRVAKWQFVEVTGVNAGPISWEQHAELYERCKNGSAS